MNLYSDLAKICHLFYKHYFPHQKIAVRLENVLEKYGCRKIIFIGGLVYVADILRRKGYAITFVDYTKEMVAEAKKIPRQSPLHLGDMRALPVKGKYDAIIATGRSFTYMHTNRAALKTLRSFAQNFNPKGIVIIDNYETGKIDKSNYFNGIIKAKWKKIVVKRTSSIRQTHKNPTLYL